MGSGRKFAVFEPQRRAERNRRGRGGLSERGQIGAESQRFGRGEGRQRDFEEQVGSALFAGRQPTVEVQPGRGFVYTTLPYGIVLTKDNIITVW